MDDITPPGANQNAPNQPVPAPERPAGSTPPASTPVAVSTASPRAQDSTDKVQVMEEKKPGKIKSALSTIAILLIAPLLALTITAFIFQSYEVDGPSMQATLENHDRLIIWKVKRTWARVTHRDYIPNRGDVIVFIKRGLYEDNSSKEKQLIKRVIALPGERVTVEHATVTVYNKEHPNGFIPDKTLPYGKVITSTEGAIDTVVPAGQVFVLGDNRANSLDSRYFGPVPASDIVGKLVARILPLGDAEKF